MEARKDGKAGKLPLKLGVSESIKAFQETVIFTIVEGSTNYEENCNVHCFIEFSYGQSSISRRFHLTLSIFCPMNGVPFSGPG